MNKHKKNIIISLILVILAAIFTIIVKTIDVSPIGPEGSSVGLATINSALTPDFNKGLYIEPDLTFIILPAIIFFYAGLGLFELIKRKSLKKVDKELFILAGLYVAIALVYIVFEKLLVINCRPVILGSALEPSYPSSHTLFALTICGSAIIINQKLFENNYTKYFNLALALIAIAIIGRRFAVGVHWFSDILGGIFISAALLSLFYLALSFVHERH